MDRKGFIVLVFALLTLLGMNFFASKVLFPPKLVPITNAAARARLNTPATAGSSSPGATIGAPGTISAPAGGPASQDSAAAKRPEKLLSLSNSAVQFIFTSHGGGLRSAALLKHPAFTASRTSPAGLDTNALLTLNLHGREPLLGLVNGSFLEGNGDFDLQSLPDGGVRAEKVMPNGLAIVREFRLTTNDYLLNARVRFENRSAADLALPALEVSLGTATPMNGHDKGEMIGVDWLDGEKFHNELGWVSMPGMFCMSTSIRESFTGAPLDFKWAAVHNQFFSLATVPTGPQKPDKITGTRITLPRPSAAARESDRMLQQSPIGVASQLQYPASALLKGQANEMTYTIYAGPKDLKTLNHLGSQLERLMGYGWFGIFATPLLLGMKLLHNAFGLGYGYCILLVTILIRAAFWPLMAMSTRSAKKMAEVGPKIKALQEKYKDDPKKQAEKMREVWGESGATPLLGCLPIFVTFPVFIGFFTMLRSAIELRGVPFLWCADLSAADTLTIIPGLGAIPMIGILGLGLPINILPLLYVGTGLWMNHTMPMSPQMDPVQQKLLRWMPVFFLFLFYNYAAGLMVYWTTNNLLTILQNKLTKTSGKKPDGTVPAKEIKVRS